MSSASASCHQVTLYCMFTAIMGFHAKISDPKIGGSYMTLLNTFANLGTILIHVDVKCDDVECVLGASCSYLCFGDG